MTEIDYAYLSKKVDELGKLKARIADLCEKESEIKILLMDSGASSIDGTKFRATITEMIRETLDPCKVRKLLTHEQLIQCTKGTVVTAVRVTCRKR